MKRRIKKITTNTQPEKKKGIKYSFERRDRD